MKRLSRVCFVFVVIGLLDFSPEYWQIFKEDKKSYKTDTFYYIIKEEYDENDAGKRIYRTPFRDIQDGDILVTDSTYCLCYRHGHAALVVNAEKGITMEAFGVGTKSEFSSLNEWRRYPHVVVLRLNAPREVRQSAAEYAKEHLIDVPYNLCTGMIDDKDMKKEYWGTQCAHLVWAAYSALGYDIDGDGGWLVTPSDLIKSELLMVVPQE